MKRNSTMVVPFFAPLLLALPTNHAMYAFAEIGCYWRELRVWLLKIALVKLLQRSRCRLQSSEPLLMVLNTLPSTQQEQKWPPAQHS